MPNAFLELAGFPVDSFGFGRRLRVSFPKTQQTPKPNTESFTDGFFLT